MKKMTALLLAAVMTLGVVTVTVSANTNTGVPSWVAAYLEILEDYGREYNFTLMDTGGRGTPELLVGRHGAGEVYSYHNGVIHRLSEHPNLNRTDARGWQHVMSHVTSEIWFGGKPIAYVISIMMIEETGQGHYGGDVMFAQIMPDGSFDVFAQQPESGNINIGELWNQGGASQQLYMIPARPFNIATEMNKIGANMEIPPPPPAPTLTYETYEAMGIELSGFAIRSESIIESVTLYVNGEEFHTRWNHPMHNHNEYDAYRVYWTLTFNALPAGTHRIQASVSDGDQSSPLSNTLEFDSRYLGPMPQATGLTLTDSTLSWDVVPGATSYFVGIARYVPSNFNPDEWFWSSIGSRRVEENRIDLYTIRLETMNEHWEPVPLDWETQEYQVSISINGDFITRSPSTSEPLTITYPFSVQGGVGAAPAPTPAPPTPQPTPQPTPAPIIVAPGASADIITTERLVSVIPPSPAAGRDLRYTVQPGETLWGIAFNYYGSMQAATVNRIAAANRDILPANNALEVGMVLTLPAQGLRQPVMQANLGDAAGVYLVRPGDTLSSIALHFFGDASQWGRIREANSPRVGTNNIIYAGQWLIIPRA